MRRPPRKGVSGKQTPIEEKESMRWLTGLREVRDVAQELPGVQCVCVADSEADIYEVFAEPRGEHPVHWLIRACQDRAARWSCCGDCYATTVIGDAETV